MKILTPNLSIIIPVYNKEENIKKCIDSVLVQTYSNIQVILLDDGSTDESSKICKEYASIDNRVIYIYQDNGGQTIARKKALEYANAEWVSFIDADDCIDKNYIETLMEPILEDNTFDLVTSGLIYDDKNSHVVIPDGINKGVYFKNEIYKVLDRVIFDPISGTRGINHSMSGKIFRKKILTEVFSFLNPELTLGEDGIAIFCFICFTQKMKVLDYAGYHYIQYSTSYIHQIDENKLKKTDLLRDQFINLSKKFEVYDKVKYSLEKHISLLRAAIIGRMAGMEYDSQFIFPKELLEKNLDIVIYGAGKKGKLLKKTISRINNWKCIGWVDQNYKNIELDFNVKPIEDLKKMHFDYVFIAIENNVIVHSVIENLINFGIPYSSIWQLDKIDMYVRDL